jgi:hypothetical protein
MLEIINESIEVVAIFKQGKVEPVKFLWQDKEYRIKKINLMYSRFEGRTKYYFFAVSDDANYFKLQFDTGGLNWTLLESHAE